MATAQELVSRWSRIGSKLLMGYIPCTVLAVLAVFITVGVYRSWGSWAALLGGGVLILLWSAQIAVTNLFILLLRFDRHFLGKALAISVASTLLLPFIGYAQHKLKLLSIGSPDSVIYLEQASGSRCKVVSTERKYRMDDYGYVVEATIRCAGESRDQTCKWIFRYDMHEKRWSSPLPLSLTCHAISTP
jgi:hypothetical protein